MFTTVAVDGYPPFQGQTLHDDERVTIFRRQDTLTLVFFDKVNGIALDLPNVRKRRRDPSEVH